ncbi:MAG: ATP synthase F1 subunit delta [Gaiellaceae bacterium]|jgi:F-type H+-transporting ATPase subunit delta
MAVVHRVYAEALLGAAKDQKAVEPIRNEYRDFVTALAESEELRSFLRNPQIESRAKREALEQILSGADERFLNFLRVLTEKGRIGEVEEIHKEWERLLAADERVLELELTTAVELSEKEAAGIVSQIEKASGRKVEATTSVDPGLIGGIVIQAGSQRLDASVRHRLEELREELLEPA